MRSIIINLDRNTEKLKIALDHLAQFGIYPERMPGVIGSTPYNGLPIAMLKALESIKDEDYAMIFEDDVVLKNFDLPEFPDNFDLIYLGANLTAKTERINDRLVKVNGAWATHAVLYSKKGVKKILEQYNVNKGIYDEWLRKSFNEDNECYLVTPMIAFQRPGYSNIEKRNVDYTPVLIDNYNKFVE